MEDNPILLYKWETTQSYYINERQPNPTISMGDNPILLYKWETTQSYYINERQPNPTISIPYRSTTLIHPNINTSVFQNSNPKYQYFKTTHFNTSSLHHKPDLGRQ